MRQSFESKYKMSPQEFHKTWAFPPDAKCSGCGNRPSIRAIVMVPLDEAERRGMIPQGAAAHPKLFPALVPLLVPIRDGSTPKFFMRTSVAYSCDLCRKDFETALAKGPSWAIVEINRGPNPTERVVAAHGD